jgi:tripartite-type tricarboxylate transporter receptor subunit TctC
MLGLAGAHAALPYPSRPVRLVVPYAPGGNVDLIARLIGQEWSTALGQPFVIENRAGAGGMLAGEAVARSPADGYTLLVGSNAPVVISPLIFPKPLYQWDKAFTPVSLVATIPMLLVTRTDLPVTSAPALIGQAAGGTLSFATGGAGSINHMASELLQMAAGIHWQQVHYNGNAPGIAALLGGHVDVSIQQLTAALPYVRRGELRALAVTGPERSRLLPDVPTLAEAGLPGVEAVSFVGVLAPLGTPSEIVARLSDLLCERMALPDVAAKFADLGAETRGGSPAKFGRFLSADAERWRAVVQRAHISPD